jgi:predicted metal-dependent enzyme (double-stranded beta helix superfamily)
MWEKLLQFGKELLSLKKQTEDNTSEIKEIRQDIKDLTEAVRELASQMQQDRTVEGKKVIDKSDSKERVFNKILEVNNSEERSQWIEFHKVIINHEEQTEEKR